jgi:hypothetical protein
MPEGGAAGPELEKLIPPKKGTACRRGMPPLSEEKAIFVIGEEGMVVN